MQLKEKLFRKFGYAADKRVRKRERMTDWEFGRADYDKSCSVIVQVNTSGSVVVVVRGDAPVDPEVKDLVEKLGGHISVHKFHLLLRNTITVDVSSDFDAIAALSAVLEDLPLRRNWGGTEWDHYYYEAPRAAGYLMQAYRALVDP